MIRALAFAAIAIVFARSSSAQALPLLHVEGLHAIVADGEAGTIELRDLRSGRTQASFEGPSDPSLVVSDDDRAAVIDNVNSTVHLIDLRTWSVSPIRLPKSPVSAAFVGGRLFILCSEARELLEVDQRGATRSTKVPRDSSFVGTHDGALFIYSRGEGTLVRFDPDTLRQSGSAQVGSFGADFEISRGIGYLAFPADATIAAIRLADLKEMERFRLGAVPIDIAIQGDTLAVADPASRKLWRTERTQSFASAFAQGFLRGFIGLGLKPPVSPDFPTAVDRVWAADGALVALDSAAGTLYVVRKGVKVVARDIAPGSFAISGSRLLLLDSGKIRQIELRQ